MEPQLVHQSNRTPHSILIPSPNNSDGAGSGKDRPPQAQGPPRAVHASTSGAIRN